MSTSLPYLVVFSPLLGFVLVGCLGSLLGRRVSNILSVALMALSCGAGCILFTQVLDRQIVVQTITFLQWINVGDFNVTWQFHLDALTATMIMVVTTVSFLVHLYSVGYMDHDDAQPRFMAYLSFFTFSMLALVTAGNMVQLFFGWEGVGLASYLLIGFWSHKESANSAAIKAFIMNRIGDVGLALGIAALYLTFKTVDIATILSHLNTAVGLTFKAGGHTFSRLEVIGFLLFIGAMGKSAQLGLHTWLPDAMEGPTPVSALIHAATMVTAGVFLVVRLSPLYELAPYAKNFIVFVGASTAFFAGTVALTQNDIKRVIAYSTCSQLGYMFFAAGLSAYHISIFHLVTHAFFKALLFLGAGAVIHALSDEQDMRRMGGIWRGIPATFVMMWIGSLALAGIPFFAGFYSKDAILSVAWFNPSFEGHYAYLLGIGSAFLTALYSWRLLIMTFNGQSRANERVLSHLHEPGSTMLIPLLVLALGALFSGVLGQGVFMNKKFWGSAITFLLPSSGHMPTLIHYLPLIAGVSGIIVAYLFYFYRSNWPGRVAQQFHHLYQFLYQKWYFDELYTLAFVRPAQKMGLFFWRQGDQEIIDGYGPNGIANRAMNIASRLSRMQSGYVFHYALVFMVGFLSLILWLWFYTGRT